MSVVIFIIITLVCFAIGFGIGHGVRKIRDTNANAKDILNDNYPS